MNKELSAFRPDKKYRSKVSCWCKECEDTYARSYRILHFDKKQKSQRAWYNTLKDEMISGYGSICECCGESEPAFLSLDHKFGGGNKHRNKIGVYGVYLRLKKLGWPRDGYRLLCMNCNFATRFMKICPHKERLMSAKSNV